MGYPDDICYCGHVRDEHHETWPSCGIEGCDCIHFEKDPNPQETEG